MQLALPAEEQPCCFFFWSLNGILSRLDTGEHAAVGCVDTNLGQHTRALERASRKRTEEQQGHTDRLDRMSKPVRPVSRVSLESVVSRDKYHTYVVKSGKVYEQTSKG